MYRKPNSKDDDSMISKRREKICDGQTQPTESWRLPTLLLKVAGQMGGVHNIRRRINWTWLIFKKNPLGLCTFFSTKITSTGIFRSHLVHVLVFTNFGPRRVRIYSSVFLDNPATIDKRAACARQHAVVVSDRKLGLATGKKWYNLTARLQYSTRLLDITCSKNRREI